MSGARRWPATPDDPLSGEELYRRLSSGRIPLTDAELVKAMLVAVMTSPAQFAAQWDSFERDLRNPQLWAHVAGSPTTGTHIELLLDAVADLEAKPDDPRPPFQTFSVLRARILSSKEPAAVAAQHLWDDVVRMHSRVMGWFADQDLYHQIGYLLSTDSVKFTELTRLASDNTASDFRQSITNRISDSIPVAYRHCTSCDSDCP